MGKRLFDFVVAFIGLILLSPVLLLIAVLIKMDSPGSAFFLGERVGQHGRPFKIMKFRTMVEDAVRLGPGITSSEDSRVTRVGRFIRRAKLDELPQLWNVVIGEMSLVGPRPEDPCYVARYSPEQREVLRVRPGITSAASLEYRNEEMLLSGPDWERVYRTQVLPGKLAIELAYLSRRTLATDVVLVLRTLACMFR